VADPTAENTGAPAALLGLAGLALGVVLAAVVGGATGDGGLTSLPGHFNDDGVQALYLHHHTHDALAAGRLTLFDPDQLVPFGAHLIALDGGNIGEMLLSGLFRLFLPWPTWYTVAALAWIPLNLLAFLPLGRHLWPRAPGSTLAAAGAWAVLPLGLGQIAAGRLTQVVMVGVPIAVLGLLRVAEKGGRSSWILAGVGLAITGLGYWFYAAFLGLLLPLFAVHGWRQRGGKPVLADLLRAGGLALGLVAPLMALVVYERTGHGWSPTGGNTAEFTSPDFADSLRLAGEQAVHVRGWLPPILLLGAAFSLWRGRRRLLWGGAAILCTVAALGPGQLIGDTLWLLPYFPLWRWVPGVDLMAHPERWLAVGGLFWTLLAADGLARQGPWLRALTWSLPAGVVATAFFVGQAPIDRWTLRVPAVWADLAQQPVGHGVLEADALATAPGGRAGAIIALPITGSQLACAYQPFVGRPLLGGMVENIDGFLPPMWMTFINENDLLRSLFILSKGTDSRPVVYQVALDELHANGFDTVVLDRKLWDQLPQRSAVPIEKRLQDALGTPRFSDKSGAWWPLPATGQPGTPPTQTGPAVGDLGPPGPPPAGGGATRHGEPRGHKPPPD
jgi:hypothetical protein